MGSCLTTSSLWATQNCQPFPKAPKSDTCTIQNRICSGQNRFSSPQNEVGTKVVVWVTKFLRKMLRRFSRLFWPSFGGGGGKQNPNTRQIPVGTQGEGFAVPTLLAVLLRKHPYLPAPVLPRGHEKQTEKSQRVKTQRAKTCEKNFAEEKRFAEDNSEDFSEDRRYHFYIGFWSTSGYLRNLRGSLLSSEKFSEDFALSALLPLSRFLAKSKMSSGDRDCTGQSWHSVGPTAALRPWSNR